MIWRLKDFDFGYRRCFRIEETKKDASRLEMEYNGSACIKTRAYIRNNYGGIKSKPYYEDLGESGGDEGEKRGVYLGESVWIHAGTIDYRSHSSYAKTGRKI
ncbi:hypothetical protein H5410_037225 [Solanum commersonii]|uniref:Uncharacterized protein n=1 Tax=Solanum commersonii TaxID=4109 RepID=A0A9J5Y6I4_SOLCO|nr:hypothetical protein H5410_037225 [Solanum commersonii]